MCNAKRAIGFLGGVAIALSIASAAAAQESKGCPDSGLGTEDACDHFEFTMGFLAGARRYDQASFAHAGGGGEVPGAGALVEPFEAPPFDDLYTFGLRYDLRLVVSYVRMTVGVDFPFARFQPAETRGTYDVAGVPREVLVRRIRPYELRFGIGGEYQVGRVAPFVDLIGEVDWASAELAVDGEKVRYESTSFGFSARAGARVYLRDWFFIAAAGEIGIVGNRFWGVELSLGFAFG